MAPQPPWGTGREMPVGIAAMIRTAYHQVKRSYPAGCLDWLRIADPERVTELKGTVEAAKDAYLAGDLAALEKALKIYKGEHLKTYGHYLNAITGGYDGDEE